MSLNFFYPALFSLTFNSLIHFDFDNGFYLNILLMYFETSEKYFVELLYLSFLLFKNRRVFLSPPIRFF